MHWGLYYGDQLQTNFMILLRKKVKSKSFFLSLVKSHSIVVTIWPLSNGATFCNTTNGEGGVVPDDFQNETSNDVYFGTKESPLNTEVHNITSNWLLWWHNGIFVAILSKPCFSISGGKWLFVLNRLPGVLRNWWWCFRFQKSIGKQ